MRKKQMAEAKKRIKMLGLMDRPVQEFIEDGTINVSNQLGLLFWANEEEMEMIRKFEEEYESVVYHVIKSYTNMGIIYNIFHVCKYEEEWEMDRGSIETGFPFVYAYNKDIPEFSDFGSIAVKPLIGGLVRVF